MKARPHRDASPAASGRGRETRARLLDAAERLFAERGFEGTSMRALTRAAGASVSAANYHFGSKEGLLRATLHRRVEPVNERRLERLDALEAAAAGRSLPLEAILDALFRPYFEERAAHGPEGYRHVTARLFADPPELVASLKRELFGPVSARFTDAIARALPERPKEELALAFQLVVGSMVHVMNDQLATAPGLEGPRARELLARDALLRHLIAYCAAGLRGGSAG